MGASGLGVKATYFLNASSAEDMGWDSGEDKTG